MGGNRLDCLPAIIWLQSQADFSRRESSMRTARHRRWFGLLYVGNLLLLCWLMGYQVFLHVIEPAEESVHAEQLASILQTVGDSTNFRFAVVGNINNSARVFRDEIVPRLGGDDFDFVISAGNAVSGGQEESYRHLHNILARLEIPYLLTFGVNEESDFGSLRYYQQFGPLFFSFTLGASHFLFIDGTGRSSFAWQLGWLERELAASSAEHRFVFIGLPVHEKLEGTPVLERGNYLEAPAFRTGLIHLFETYDVDVVFSANLSLYSRLQDNGVDYVTTGGAGGLVIDNEASFHHYVDVRVSEEGLAIEPVMMNILQPHWQRTLDSIWGALYSFLYVSYLRFLLVISGLIVLAVFLHRKVIRSRDYYPDFEVDSTRYAGKSLRIAMYSNNYFPFVSGVTVSVDRLRRGLLALGDRVLLFVPQYPEKQDDDKDIVRASTVVAFGAKGEFRLANPFLPRLRRCLKSFKPDIIHVHHPFWLGALGLFMGRLLNVPVVYTYHTRLEHFAHFVPLPGLLFRNLISHYMIRRFSNKCQGVVVPTHSAEEYLRVIGVTTNTLVQPTGIDTAYFRVADKDRVAALRRHYGIAEDEIVLLSVSRISREKNITFMLEALAQRRDESQSWSQNRFRFLLVGDGPDRASIEADIRRHELTEEVILVGAVPPEEMVNYYHLGDIFVFASKSETQGMVILEAMSAGLPVVAVRSSGIDDVVQEGGNGYKTAENRQIWAQRIEELIEDEALREALGERARRFAADYDVSVYAHHIHGFYAFLLAQYHEGRHWLR